MASRADIHAHLQAIGQLVEQLYEAPPSDVHHRDNRQTSMTLDLRRGNGKCPSV